MTATIVYLEDEADEAVDLFEDRIAPAVAEDGGSLLGYFVTEPSENTFPSLPVREGVQVLVWFVGYDDRLALEPASTVAHTLGRPAEVLRLAPTSRSLLDGRSTPIGRTREREEIR